MRKSLISLCAFVPLAFAQQQTFTYTYDGPSIAVYPDDWNTFAIAAILVPKSIQVSKVTAAVQVQFDGVGDLNVYMWSAAGTRTKLLERNCGGLQNVDTTFDDSASSKYSDFCPVEPGRGPFRGNEPLANSNRENALGYWLLGVENNGSGKTGFLTGFSVTITGTLVGPPVIGPDTILSISSLQSGTVAPGDYISIFGANLGPVGGARADASQPLPTSLGQTSVTFDGQSAPLFYASDGFVAVQAPFNLTPGSLTRVRVTSAAGDSLDIPVPVATTNPGIFTYDSRGRGQAKIVNEDGSSNGDGSIIASQVPAARGSIVAIFCTGLGAVAPSVPVGTPPPADTLSTTVLPVSATIAGQHAMVMFAGLAPGQTGLYQVNVLIPSTVPSGAVRLVISADDNSSQNGVTIQIE